MYKNIDLCSFTLTFTLSSAFQSQFNTIRLLYKEQSFRPLILKMTMQVLLPSVFNSNRQLD